MMYNDILSCLGIKILFFLSCDLKMEGISKEITMIDYNTRSIISECNETSILFSLNFIL